MSASPWRRLAIFRPRRRSLALAALAICAGVAPGAAHAGGGPENVLLVVDPSNAVSLDVANYYKAARGIPDANVLYMPPGAATYQEFGGFQVDALLGSLATRDIADHIDYVVVPPGGSFYVPAVGLVEGRPCTELRRISTSSAYTLAFARDEILAGDRTYSEANRFHAQTNDPVAFDSETRWLRGVPSDSDDARRYFVGFMLGYDGERGNTVAEIKTMIDRSVAADGSHPDGTFYFVRTSDIRSTPRHLYFQPMIAALADLGGRGEELFKENDTEVLVPAGRHDILGVMTGHAGPPIDAADMTLLPGAFADHITSFAATFDTGGQTKMSRWIAKGASGTMGTVEEPCVFGEGVTGKFPHPRLDVWYFQGMSLGESLFRSIQWAPYQGLFLGDPLTRPFATFPEIVVPDAPAFDASGVLTLHPRVTPGRDGVEIAALELLVDGRRWTSGAPGEALAVDTTLLADGPHDVRVVAYEDSAVRTQGRWIGTVAVDNAGRSADIAVTPQDGDLTTVFGVDVTAGGGTVAEIRLRHGERVIAATPNASGHFTVPGVLLGAGTVNLWAEAEFADGRRAASGHALLEIGPSDDVTPRTAAPVAFDYAVDVLPDQPTLIDLPGLDAGGNALRVELVERPDRALVTATIGAALLTPLGKPSGTDSLTYRVVGADTPSAPATVTVRYCAVPWIVSRPTGATVCPGADATFAVIAGGRDLSYRWLKDGRPVPGAVGTRLTVSGSDAGSVGDYAVEVTTHCGTVARRVVSAPARLSLRADTSGCGARLHIPFAAVGRR